jgi:hypothetical protein
MADDGKQRAEYLITKVGKMGKHEKERINHRATEHTENDLRIF